MSSTLLALVGVAFAAFCVLLAVRITNRRERWAKWTAAALLGVPVLYVVGFGPACWLRDRDLLPEEAITIYLPVARACVSSQSLVVRRAMFWHGELLPTPQPANGVSSRRWSTVEDLYYAAAISQFEIDESEEPNSAGPAAPLMLAALLIPVAWLTARRFIIGPKRKTRP
jgi:hypothetical protein